MVRIEIISKKGKLKASLPLERAMACAAVASQSTKQRDHVFLKVGYFIRFHGETVGHVELSFLRRQLGKPPQGQAQQQTGNHRGRIRIHRHHPICTQVAI